MYSQEQVLDDECQKTFQFVLACKNVSSSPLIKCCSCCKLRQASFGLKARSQIGYKQSIFESCINRVNAFMSLLTDILSMVSREPRRLALARIQGTEQNLAKKYQYGFSLHGFFVRDHTVDFLNSQLNDR